MFPLLLFQISNSQREFFFISVRKVNKQIVLKKSTKKLEYNVQQKNAYNEILEIQYNVTHHQNKRKKKVENLNEDSNPFSEMDEKTEGGR